MSDEMKNKIHKLRSLFVTGLDRIAEWNQYVPILKKTEEELAWIEDSIDHAPAILNNVTDEVFLDHITKAGEEAAILGTIPQPGMQYRSTFTTSGSASSSDFDSFVRYAATTYADEPDVYNWANITIAKGAEMRERQNRSAIVFKRLTQLNPDLGQLYKDSIEATLSATTTKEGSVAAAALLDRVLEQFKGELVGRFKRSDRATYQKISDHLAANSSLTKTVVADEQVTYNRINLELVDIRKSMKDDDGERVTVLLHDIEDHIIVVTDALDPSLTGITFEV